MSIKVKILHLPLLICKFLELLSLCLFENVLIFIAYSPINWFIFTDYKEEGKDSKR